MTTCPYTYAKEHDIQIKHYDFEEFSGICGTFWNKSLIWIKNWYDPITEREVLWHELWHFLSWTENNIHFSKWDEQEADKFGREFLIPTSELIRAIEDNEWICDTYCLATIFGVSAETMQARVREVFNLPTNF